MFQQGKKCVNKYIFDKEGKMNMDTTHAKSLCCLGSISAPLLSQRMGSLRLAAWLTELAGPGLSSYNKSYNLPIRKLSANC